MPDRRNFTDREGVFCLLPTTCSPEETRVYRDLHHLLRERHCAAGEASHECQGRIILDRNGITLSCPRCGDARSVFEREGDAAG